MDIINALLAFNIGLFSTLHCLGMCGGISTALSLSIPDDHSSKPLLVLAYNLGRISSYTLAGMLAGLLGSVLALGLLSGSGHRLLQYIAGLILILIGLQIGGWIRILNRLESAGMIIWRQIQPLTKRLFPINSFIRGLAAGFVWGWLPCALVYSTLLWSASSGNPVKGGLIMLFFGLGTLPGMFLAGVSGAGFRSVLQDRGFRRVAGLVIVLFGLVSPFLYQAAHHQHLHQHKMTVIEENTGVIPSHLGFPHPHPSGSGAEVFRDLHIARTARPR